jgi:hypothetical protein
MASMDAEQVAALTPVVADLAHGASLRPEFEDYEWPVPGMVATMLLLPDAGGAGVAISIGAGRTGQVVSVADQVQMWAVEALWGAGRSPVWPECPEHPDTHPLQAVERSGAAVWVCPVSLHVVCHIGSLA